MMKALIAACALTLSANLGGAAETYYRASLGDLELVGGSLPDDAVAIGSRWRRAEAFEP